MSQKYGELATLRVSDIEVSDNSLGDGGSTDSDVQSTQCHTNLTNVDCWACRPEQMTMMTWFGRLDYLRFAVN